MPRLDGTGGLLARARAGDAEARETLLRRYAPVALKAASSVTGTYVQLGRDDEASIALMAFNEAVDAYDPGRGASFLGFAREVVRRRLIDHLRRVGSRSRETPLSAFGELDEAGAGGGPPAEAVGLRMAEVAAAELAYRDQEEAYARQEEVLRYREILQTYGITLAELVRLSPRHADARRRAIEAARLLAGRKELVSHLVRRRELPLRELEALCGLSRKTLERQRKYIIAVTLVLVEDLPHLEAYLE